MQHHNETNQPSLVGKLLLATSDWPSTGYQMDPSDIVLIVHHDPISHEIAGVNIASALPGQTTTEGGSGDLSLWLISDGAQGQAFPIGDTDLWMADSLTEREEVGAYHIIGGYGWSTDELRQELESGCWMLCDIPPQALLDLPIGYRRLLAFMTATTVAQA